MFTHRSVTMFFIVTLLVASSSTVNAGKELDSERVAQVLANQKVELWEGYFSFDRHEAGKYVKFVQGQFYMTPRGEITFLSIDGETIVDPNHNDSPLAGIPQNAKGEARNFNLDAYGYDSVRKFVQYGYFHKELLLPGDPIVVVIQLAYVRQDVPYQLPQGADPQDVELRLEDLAVWPNTFSYDSNAQGFSYIYVNPLQITPYTIVDKKTGVILAKDEVDVTASSSPAVDGVSIISIVQPKAVVGVYFESTNETRFEQQELDGTVERNAPCPNDPKVTCRVEVEAKVFLVDTGGQGLSVSFSDSLQGYSFKVEVRGWTATGDMPVVGATSSGSSSVDVSTVDVSTYGKLILTILPQVIGERHPKFGIKITRSGKG